MSESVDRLTAKDSYLPCSSAFPVLFCLSLSCVRLLPVKFLTELLHFAVIFNFVDENTF